MSLLMDLGIREYTKKFKTWVESEINKRHADFVGSAPETLDTLQELAAALGNDENFATTITTELGKKVNKSDITTPDWNANINESGYIQNRTHFTEKIDVVAHPVDEYVYSFEIGNDPNTFIHIKDESNDITIVNELVDINRGQSFTFTHNDKNYNVHYWIADDFRKLYIRTGGTETNELITYLFSTMNVYNTHTLPEKYLPDTIARKTDIISNVEAVPVGETIEDVDTNTYLKYVPQALTTEEQAQSRTNIGIVLPYEFYTGCGGTLNERQYNAMVKYMYTPFMVSNNSVTNIPDELLNENKTSFVTEYYWNMMRITGGEPFVTTQWNGNIPYKFKGILNNKTFVIDFANKKITPES